MTARMDGDKRCSCSAVNRPRLLSHPLTKTNTSICCQDLLLWFGGSCSNTSNLIKQGHSKGSEEAPSQDSRGTSQVDDLEGSCLQNVCRNLLVSFLSRHFSYCLIGCCFLGNGS